MCMGDQGVSLPSESLTEVLLAGGEALPRTISKQRIERAVAACDTRAIVVRSVAGDVTTAQPIRRWTHRFARCLRRSGVKVQGPNFSYDAPALSVSLRQGNNIDLSGIEVVCTKAVEKPPKTSTQTTTTMTLGTGE